MATDCLSVLSNKTSRFGELENELVGLLGYLRFDFIKLLLLNRKKIVFCTRLGQAQSAQEKEEIEKEMGEDPELEIVLQRLKGGKAQGESGTISNRAKKEQRCV